MIANGPSSLIAAISTDVVASLNAAGYPFPCGNPENNTLANSKIMFGRQYLKAQFAPPRIVAYPVATAWRAKDPSGALNVTQEMIQNAIHTEDQTYAFHVWCVASPPDPDGQDYDMTWVYYQQILRSIYNLTGDGSGIWKASAGAWTSAKDSTGQLIVDGQEFVFSVTFGAVLANYLAQYAPHNVTAIGTVTPNASAPDAVTITSNVP